MAIKTVLIAATVVVVVVHPPTPPTNCGFCCGDSAPSSATVTVSGVTGTECCGSWNSTWELALVAIPNPPGADSCTWELLSGCGVDPRIDLSIGTCFSGLQLLSIRFAADRTTVPYQSAAFTHLGFGALDCSTFWSTAWSFDYSGNNNGCDFTGASVTVSFN